MKFLWFLLFVFTFVFRSYGQTYSGIVLDANRWTLSGVQIQDTVNNLTVLTNSGGKFSIQLQPNSLFEFTLIGYETVYISLPDLKDTVQLFTDARLLESIVINSDKIKTVIDRPRVNILDYRVYPEFVLTLYAEKGERFLSMEGFSIEDKVISLAEIKGKSLVEDCFGNVHLLTKDKAYLLSITSDIRFVSNMPLAKFNQLIRPCEAVMGSNLMISENTNHGQKYTLAIKKKPEPQFTPFYTIWDRETEGAAIELYWEIVGMYMVASDTISNIIINKVWDGETMRELAINGDIMPFVGYYEGVASKEIEVLSFQVNNDLLVFDLCFDSLHVFNKEGNHMSVLQLQKGNGKGSQTIIMDKARNEFYRVDFNSGSYSFSRIKLSDGTLEDPFEFTEVSFPKNIQIFDGSLYFLVPQSGFHKLYRLRLNE